MFCRDSFTNKEYDILRCLQKVNSSYKSGNPWVRTVVFYSQFFQSFSLQNRASHIKSLFSFVCSLDFPFWKLLWEQLCMYLLVSQGGLSLSEVFWVFHVRFYILNYEWKILFFCGLQIHMGKVLTFFSKKKSLNFQNLVLCDCHRQREYLVWKNNTQTWAVNCTTLKKSLQENYRYKKEKKE